MEPAPQQIEEDVFVGSRQTPPKLEVLSRRYGLLEDLIVLGYVPVTEAVVWSMGLTHQDRSHQLPNELASSTLEDTLMDYLVRGWVRRSHLECHPATRWSRNILPSWSHVVAAGQTDPSLAEAVHPRIGPLGRQR